MTKKTIVITSLVIISLSFFYGLATNTKTKKIITETIPLLNPKPTPQPTKTIKSADNFYRIPETNYQSIVNSPKTDLSINEIAKLSDYLPIRINDFITSNGTKTTINIYTISSDPNSVIRIEIYGVNFNNINSKSKDALAFRDSFLEAKKSLINRKVNLQNLEIIYGNRQYIQSTASYWVKEFKLLD